MNSGSDLALAVKTGTRRVLTLAPWQAPDAESIDEDKHNGASRLPWQGKRKMEELKEKIVNTSFFSISQAIFSRRKHLLLLFSVCLVLLLHSILTNISPQLASEKLESLEELSRKLNFAEGGGFSPQLWGPEFVDATGRPKVPLPTNVWWQAFVLPPGTGDSHVINSAPYLLTVITKPRGRTDLVGDRAGLQVRGPYTVVDNSSDGGVYGYRQTNGPVGYGFFFGVRLRDFGDFVKRHYVSDYSPLSVTKSWEIEQFREGTDEVVDPTEISTQTTSLQSTPKRLYNTYTPLCKKNSIQKIVNLASLPTDGNLACSSLLRSAVFTDALELHLSDGTIWLFVLDHKVCFGRMRYGILRAPISEKNTFGEHAGRLPIMHRWDAYVTCATCLMCSTSCLHHLCEIQIQMTCESSTEHDRLMSLKRLERPVIVRLAVASVCGHSHVWGEGGSNAMIGVDKTCPHQDVDKKSSYRWKFMSLVNKVPGRRLDEVANFINRRRQLELLRENERWGGFELQTVAWTPDALIPALRNMTVPINAVVIPEGFFRGDGTGITGDLYYWLAVHFLSVQGGTIVLVGGMNGEGKTRELLRDLFNIHLEPAGFFSYDDAESVPHQTHDIYDTPPYEEDEGIDESLLPENMPKKLRRPMALIEDPVDGSEREGPSNNKVEAVWTPWHGWPFQSCGLEWTGATMFCCRMRIGPFCSQEVYGILCVWAPLGTQAFTKEMSTTLLDEDGLVDVENLRRFLRGTKVEETLNVGQPSEEIIDEDRETARDGLLRQALIYPVKGDFLLRTSSADEQVHVQHAKLTYKFLSFPLPQYESHSLYPPYVSMRTQATNDVEPLWDPNRLIVYMHELHQVIMSESAATSCLVTNHGTPAYLLVNLVESDLGVLVKRNETGDQENLLERMHPQWENILRWAIRQDLSGPTKLDIGDLDQNADDMQEWVRLMHRYASIALTADAVGVRVERERALSFLRRGLEKFLGAQFENVLLYDTTWAEAMSSQLSSACPALRNSEVEAGAGLYYGTHAFFGYVVHMAAVVAKFDLGWLSRRLSITTQYGLRTPKIHHVVLALIRNFATPAFLQGYKELSVTAQLRQFFVVARHKDWWFLNSYSSGVQHPDALGPHQESSSEAAFAYWAVAMYAKVTGDRRLEQWGRVLAATEIYAANAYIHIKESVRYLGAIGRLHENAAVFNTIEGVEPFKIFSKQIIPLTPFSLEIIDAGWALWMTERWRNACVSNLSKCFREFGDIGLTHMSLFTQKWTAEGGPDGIDREATIKAEIEQATQQVLHINCFQVKSFDCGVHTLSNALFFVAMTHALGGAPTILDAEDGNGRYRIY
uniref:glucan endo-1,3-beta-D-glucosidase n=1 Tax=Toxoplasma gondii (strain ATCC 50861 / VEG) TaxID=432359 RepID=A0A0F7UQK4_TOXGV|nr:TPA: endo-1,3(4)-beta-glucanase [Toxoplasma gondii VEG]